MNDQKTHAMKTNGADLMGTGAIGKVLAQMSWPAILSMTINALYNIVDSIFVARLSQEALTAVSFVMPMQLLMISVTVGSGIGVNSLIARRLGARRQEEAEQAAGNSILIGLFNYMLFLIIGLFVTVPFMRHYTTEPSIYGYGVTYMRLVLTLSLFSSVEVIMEKVMQATGNMKGPMICSLSGAITNIILDPVLIFGLCGAPRLEVAGAAIATVIGQAVAFIIALFFLKRQKVLKLGRHSLRPRPAIIKDIYAVGFPSIVMQAIGSVMMIGYNTILAAEPTAVAVLGAYQKLQSFVFMPVFGLNQGALPLMGYNYGARNRERLMRTYKLALLAAITIMAIGFLLFQSIPHLFLKLFSADAKMLQMGIPALRRISICFLPAAYGIMTSTLFQATGHGTYSLFSSLIRQLVGILPLAYILYHYGGVEVSWLSFPLAEILGVLYMVLTFRHLYVKEIKNLDHITEN
ncbi:MAG: MATE family efflux transporter [Firmicutes bacterium]|nr:MATE family efflux transporter [Bacillota bacterium]